MNFAGISKLNDIKLRNCDSLSRSNSVFSKTSNDRFSRHKSISSTVRVTKREKLSSKETPRVESIISNSSTKSNRSSNSSRKFERN